MNFATIKQVFDDGVTLSFDDGSTSTKHYKVNSGVVFNAGDRVRIAEDGNSYVVEYVVGSPTKSISAGTASRLSTACKITLSGDVTGEATFDGSSNIAIKVTAARATALKNAYAPSDTKKDITLYAATTNALQYKVGTAGTRTKLSNA